MIHAAHSRNSVVVPSPGMSTSGTLVWAKSGRAACWQRPADAVDLVVAVNLDAGEMQRVWLAPRGGRARQRCRVCASARGRARPVSRTPSTVPRACARSADSASIVSVMSTAASGQLLGDASAAQCARRQTRPETTPAACWTAAAPHAASCARSDDLLDDVVQHLQRLERVERGTCGLRLDGIHRVSFFFFFFAFSGSLYRCKKKTVVSA